MSKSMMMLSYLAELEFACLYSMRRPKLARKCARAALSMAQQLQRPDLAYRANALLGGI